MHKIDKKAELKSLAEAGKINRTEANKRYIRFVEGQQEHIYRGELPFPDLASRIKSEVLAIRGQVMYLYTKDWQKGI